MWIGYVIVAALAGASVLAAEAEAVAHPVPVPVHARAVKRVHEQARHPRRVRRHRPHTVVRCQNDGTDQLDEIDNDGDEPLHYVSPDNPVQAGRCPGIREALGLAGVLSGSSRPRRAARPVR